MSAETTIRVPARLHMLAGLAMLLERLERQPRSASAEQYRLVVQHLADMLDDADDDPALAELLSVFPATAELHENRHYAQSGLAQSPLDMSVDAELAARDAIGHARQRG